MGAKYSRNDRVEPGELIGMERSLSEENENFKQMEDRHVTDSAFVVIMALFYVVLLGFVGYCIFNGDVYRILNGYDNCGNVCGRTNAVNSVVQNCSGKNMTQFPFLLIKGSSGFSVVSTNVQRMCVKNCSEYPQYQELLNRCIPKEGKEVVNTFFSKTGLKNFFQETTEDLHLAWRELIYLCLIALASSVVIMILLRYLVGVVVWVVLIGVSFACLIGTAYLWMLWAHSNTQTTNENMRSDVDTRKCESYRVFAILSSVVTVVVLLIIIAMRKRIQLVIQLFREAGKAVSAMPFLLFEPLLTFASLVAVLFLWVYFSIWIESSGHLKESRVKFIHYHKDIWINLTRWYNLLGMFWMTQFIVGCQHMIISGAVSIWYFSRNKNNLESPILVSAHNLIRYHLGSVALGSLIIALVQLLRVALKVIEKFLRGREGRCVECALTCCKWCFACFEAVLKYLSRNAYIEIAIFGHSFCTAGKQAFKLLASNALRVTAINSVGDFVLFLGKVLVVMATVLIGVKMLQEKEGLQHLWVPLAISGLFAYLISHCFLTVYEMSIDTIFLCFCEDCAENDGISKPYYMSRGLMEFVQNSKKAVPYQDSRTAKGAWQEGLSTISETVADK